MNSADMNNEFYAQCISETADFSASGCKALIGMSLFTALLRSLTTILTIFFYSKTYIVVSNEIDFDTIEFEDDKEQRKSNNSVHYQK